MADREIVITHLQIIHTWAEFAREHDLQFFTAQHLKDIAQWADDALNLLKEQEAVEPSFNQDEKGIFVWCCGSCGAYMYHIYDGIDKAKEYAKFCRQCGKPVLWESR